MYDAIVSCDLGRQADYTAIVVAEEARWVGSPPELGPGAPSSQLEKALPWQGLRGGWTPPSAMSRPQREHFRNRNYGGDRPDRPPLLVRHVERVRGRPYPQIVKEIGALLARPPLSELSAVVLVDAGGVGVAVSDLMWQQGIPHVSITATGGDRVNVADGGRTIHCPKRELVAAAQIALAEGRLRIASGLEHAATLTKELSEYQVKISSTGHDSYSARDGAHDDLVYATAQLCWFRDWYSQHFDDAIAAQAAHARRF